MRSIAEAQGLHADQEKGGKAMPDKQDVLEIFERCQRYAGTAEAVQVLLGHSEACLYQRILEDLSDAATLAELARQRPPA